MENVTRKIAGQKENELNRLRIIAAVISMSCLLQVASAADRTTTLQSLLHEMTDRDAVAHWPDPPYTCREASSYDRATVAPDKPGWFGNNDFSQFIRVETTGGHSEHVMMDADGPGCIVRFWLTTDGDRRGTIRIYLDGAAEPALHFTAYDLMAGGLKLDPPLLQAHTSYRTDHGGNTLHLPIPYAHHCKVTWEQPAHTRMGSRYYQLNYRTYPAGTVVESFNAAALEAARPMIKQISAALLTPADFSNGSATQIDQSIAPAHDVRIDLPSGPGAVRLLQIKLATETPDDLEQALRSTVLRLTFDGQETAWCPLSDFSGSGVGNRPLISWYRTVDAAGTITARWVMPYAKSARITLSNLGTCAVQAALLARTSPQPWDKRSLYFHTTWHQETAISTKNDRDWNFNTITGRGILVGDTLAVFNPARAWYGEGDEKIFVDGESFPSHMGTGTEDYYNASYAPVVPYNTPFANAPRVDDPTSQGHNTFTRTRNLDAIPFNQSLKFDMELIHWHRGTLVDYAATTYWYGSPGAATAILPLPQEAARPVAAIVSDTPIVPGAIECETLPIAHKSGDLYTALQTMNEFDGHWSRGVQLLAKATKIGDSLDLRIGDKLSGSYKVTLYATKAPDYGILQLAVNGQNAAHDFDGYCPTVTPSGPIELGEFVAKDGTLLLHAQVVGANRLSRGARFFFGLDCIVVSKL
jgi:hypothetical protein